ncbi:MAG: ABC transporter permease [Chloroflexi bacterium]|nr:ABC transporter permease [Chloroflexota bacterium]
MITFLVNRLLQLLLVVWGSVTIVFLLLHLSGDPAKLMLSDLATPEQLAAVQRELGTDQPFVVQYVKFLGRAAVGDFGNSIRQQRPVVTIVLERLPATLQLAVASVVISTVLGIVFGVAGAVFRRTIYDRLLLVVALLGQSMPPFWLAIMLILFFAIELRILPASGSGDWRHFVLPAVTLGAFSLARTARLTRTSMLEVLSQDYVRTARAKGLAERVVIFVHAFKNAAISVVTVTGFTFSTLIGGAVITEAIFAWPGVGSLLVDGVTLRDYPLVLGAVFATAVLVAVTNLVVDLLYSWLDPRIARA